MARGHEQKNAKTHGEALVQGAPAPSPPRASNVTILKKYSRALGSNFRIKQRRSAGRISGFGGFKAANCKGSSLLRFLQRFGKGYEFCQGSVGKGLPYGLCLQGCGFGIGVLGPRNHVRR